MAIDAYLQIEGIKGESLDSTHVAWIECTTAQCCVGVEPQGSLIHAFMDTRVATKKLAVNGFYWSLEDKKTRVLIVRDAGFWTILDLLETNFGGERGIRTPDRL